MTWDVNNKTMFDELDHELYQIKFEDRGRKLSHIPNINLLRDQNCFALNFGWPTEMIIPFISLSLSSKIALNIDLIKKSAPSGCFLVMIGGRYVPRTNDIVLKVKEFSEHVHMKSLVYIGQKTEVMPELNSNTPAIVSIKSSLIYEL